uniref:Uncharacterized protein n=1 Tax=Arundo donax TaxID=35708 RepID=A0A0A9CG54_ARUDO
MTLSLPFVLLYVTAPKRFVNLLRWRLALCTRALDCKPLMRLSPHYCGLWKMMIRQQLPLMV